MLQGHARRRVRAREPSPPRVFAANQPPSMPT
jgi:hypothetical protein